MIYGMKKTTVYLPEEMKAALGRVAGARGSSEADLIRDAVGMLLAESLPPRPVLPLFDSGDSGDSGDATLAERVADNPEKELSGFGT